MKHRTVISIATLALVAGLAVGFTSYQRLDMAGPISGDATLTPDQRANSAATGAWVDIANYSGAMLAITTGQVDAAAYVVLQDSSAGLAVAASDSVQIAATADTSLVKLGYKGTRRFIRALQRASGNAADTIETAALVLRTGARTR